MNRFIHIPSLYNGSQNALIVAKSEIETTKLDLSKGMDFFWFANKSNTLNSRRALMNHPGSNKEDFTL